MAYIGRGTDKISNVEVLDNITFDGSSSYTLQKSSVNFTPSSANTLLLSIDGVVQAGNFTVSGSTIDFGTAVAGTSTCNFVLHYGVGLITTVADGAITAAKLGANSVTSAKLNNDIISGTTELASEPADTDEFLVSDAGTLKRIDYSLIKGGGITEADCWRITADTVGGTNAVVSSNWERNDTSGFSKIGTGLSESSGIFSFPSTGIYLINYYGTFSLHGDDYRAEFSMEGTLNNSSYATIVNALAGNGVNQDAISGSASNTFIFDVTNTSNCKFKFATSSFSTNTLLLGHTSYNYTGFTSVRLGDT